MDSVPHERRCNACGKKHPLTAEYFHKDKKAKHGFSYRCKVCAKLIAAQWQKDHPGQANQRKQDYVERHPERVKKSKQDYADCNRDAINAKHREFKAANRERMRFEQRIYYLNHRDAILAKDKKRRLANPDRERERQKRWRKENPGKARATVQRRRARRNNLENTFTDTDWQRALDYFENKCAVCGRIPDFWTTLAMDHWQPLEKGGATIAGNIVPLCHHKSGVPSGSPCCNRSKGARQPEVWLPDRFGKKKGEAILNRVHDYFEWLKSQSS